MKIQKTQEQRDILSRHGVRYRLDDYYASGQTATTKSEKAKHASNPMVKCTFKTGEQTVHEEIAKHPQDAFDRGVAVLGKLRGSAKDVRSQLEREQTEAAVSGRSQRPRKTKPAASKPKDVGSFKPVGKETPIEDVQFKTRTAAEVRDAADAVDD